MNFQILPLKKSFSGRGRICVLIASLAWILASPNRMEARDGRALFEEAYRIEKSQPERAAGLYRSALEAGLPAELGKAARWRLFFVCREQGWYLEGFEILKSVSHKDSIEDSLLDDVRSQWGLKRDEFLNLARALRGFRKGKTPTEQEMASLRVAHNAGSNRFKAEMERWLKDQGREAVIVQLAAGDRNLSEGESAIRTASYWIDRNDADRARQALAPQLNSENLSREERGRMLYLLGRLERQSENPNSAVLFRMAANYAAGSERNRMMALAAFTLYREGQADQAWALTRGVTADSIGDQGMQLFLTVLAADVKGDENAIARLRAQEKSLRKQERGFLTIKALEILRRHPLE